jgi:hypothetical protein
LKSSLLPRYRNENCFPRNSAKIAAKYEMIRESNDGTGGCCGEGGDEDEDEDEDEDGRGS